jgi:hypothetical protein
MVSPRQIARYLRRKAGRGHTKAVRAEPKRHLPRRADGADEDAQAFVEPGSGGPRRRLPSGRYRFGLVGQP